MNIVLMTHLYKLDVNNHLNEDTCAIHYFAKEWIKQGHRVNVIHTYDFNFTNMLRRFKTQNDIRYTIDGVEVFFTTHHRYIPKSTKYFPFQIKLYTEKIIGYIDSLDYEPDIFICHIPTMHTQVIKNIHNKLKCRTVAVLHQTDLVLTQRQKNNLQFINSYFDYIGYRSINLRKKFEEIGEMNPNSFIASSGTPIFNDIGYYQIGQYEKKSKSLLCVSKLIYRKNVDAIIKAISLLTPKYDLYLTIIGEGPQKNSLLKLTKKLKLEDRVVFKSGLSREQVLLEMQQSEIFTLISSNETLGLVYLEALSQGNIVIGSKNEGIDGIIKDGINGWLVDSGDYIGLAKKIEEIFNMSIDDKKLIIEKALETSIQYTEKNMAYEYIQSIKL